MSRELIASYTRKDFRVDTYAGTGPGGQHRNKCQSCVRITHLESGLVASCCETRHQHQNKKIAFQRLGVLIKTWWANKLRLERIRNNQVVRTYHAVDNRVKDHASGLEQPYRTVLDDPTDMITARHRAQEPND